MDLLSGEDAEPDIVSLLCVPMSTTLDWQNGCSTCAYNRILNDVNFLYSICIHNIWR